ncbi:MAG: transcriptional repressor [Selenomonas sp.]|uniref:Fur family transcriptional regulator n=1 Tax=Selenomonas sp. TaxID=2053611 RepID=UPI0025F484D9|nr:Fur family transcriptional regulator [Selenomonas sp.]MCR5438939.1 transcriptional repressor [Selenomonas sp.]
MKTRLKPKEVTALLREHGFKVTPQRLAVYDVLAHTTAHPNAETIYQELQPYYPTMSLATVYKALAILCEVGLAQELNLGEEAFRYDANTSHHPHVRCTCCGRVDDIMGNLSSEAMEQQAAVETGYAITDHQYYFFGICPECQKAGKGGKH